MTFQKALAFSLEREGGYVNDPNDPGGETNFGISKRAHPEVDIPNLTMEQVSDIYWEEYWSGSGGSLSNGSPMDGLQAVLFDFAIHSGTDRAVSELQKIVETAVDGTIGPQTRAAVNRKAFELLALELCKRRRSFLRRLVKRNDKLRVFVKGWAKRVTLLEDAVERGQFDAEDT